MVTVITWDRLRAPHRDPRKPIAVVDPRTYRDACRRVDRLVALDEVVRARTVATAICLWLRNEIRSGRKTRRIRRASELETWELRMATELNVLHTGEAL
jgi:hypothetical protein